MCKKPFPPIMVGPTCPKHVNSRNCFLYSRLRLTKVSGYVQAPFQVGVRVAVTGDNLTVILLSYAAIMMTIKIPTYMYSHYTGKRNENVFIYRTWLRDKTRQDRNEFIYRKQRSLNKLYGHCRAGMR